MKSSFAAAALAVFLGLFSMSTPARAESILNHLFPSIFGAPDTGPKPEDTLQAPFGGDKPAEADAKSGLMKMYEIEQSAKDADSIDQPHRSSDQIGEWLTSIVTQALTIDPRNYKTDGFSPLFTPYAFKEYQTYLTNQKTIDMLNANNMKLTAFAESKPVLVQEGTLDGTYRWLFRIPVMLTYYDRVVETLKGNKKPISQTQRILVNIQVGRTSLKSTPEGMIIERWSVTSG
jgi:hypothetical protein